MNFSCIEVPAIMLFEGGYKNFILDVEQSFKNLLTEGLLTVIKNEDHEKGQLHHVVLGSSYQYLDFMIEWSTVQFYLIEKASLKFIYVDDLLQLLGIDFKEQKSKYLNEAYKEIYANKALSDDERMNMIKEHAGLADLYTYARLIETVLYRFVFESKESWVDFAEAKGKELFQTKVALYKKLG